MIPIDSALHGDVIIYQSGEENISTNVLFKDETFWMAQKDMATLFSVQVPALRIFSYFQNGNNCQRWKNL